MRVVFLDRDGVISENRIDHVKSWDEFCFLPGALTALRWLHEAGFYTFVVTNQAIVNRGICSAQVVEEINMRMVLQVAIHGGWIHDLRYCPHDYHENCACRKPRPGMLLHLAARWNLDLPRSYLIGDAWTDIAAGRAANCRCILVRSGRGAEQVHLPETQQYLADHIAADLVSAVIWLFSQEGIALPHQDIAAWSQYAVSAGRCAALTAGG
jgi:D-glycero-D-manno-heptose 1,7-bisphosphate phosphatase